MKIKKLVGLLALLVKSSFVFAQTQDAIGQEHAIIQSDRQDGRYLSTYGVVHAMLSHVKPECAFQPDMTFGEFREWQHKVRDSMKEIMKFPDIKGMPVPKRIGSEQRDGYRLEKWEFYPLPECVSTFLVLIPDSVQQPVPAVLCIPGSGGSKEGLAGEPGIAPKLNDDYLNPKVTMARNFAKAGYVAVAVDNPAAGEVSDLERYVRGRNYNYDLVSRVLLELGWSYLGYTSYLDMQVLQWMKKQPDIRKDRIIVSGFSLGTEPLMVLGTMDASIYAFVYNDFLCQTQERALVMTVPDKTGTRPFPNSIRHLIPDFWRKFNFPDLVASLAPRPLILTEGGLDRDLNLVRTAYKIAGQPENVEIHHYPKYADSKSRTNLEALPEGLDRDEFYKLVNVDGSNHYFKSELVLPWLKKHLE